MSIQVSVKNRMLVLPYNPAVEQLIPHAKKFSNGSNWLAIPHRRDEVRLLANIGQHAPAPILYYYDWAGDKPFSSQKETAALLSTSTRAYVLSEMGVGKTRGTLYAADYLMHEAEVTKAIIVAPLSTLTPVWYSEIFRYFKHRKAVVVYGTRKKRLAILKDTNYDFYIINHDALHIIEKELALRPDINLVIIDELAIYRNSGTERFKTLSRVVGNKKYAWGLTGAPTPNAPTDAWAQCKLLTPERVHKYFKYFRQQTMLQVTQYKWIPRDEANDIVRDAMRPAVRFTRDECFDLPKITVVDRQVDMSKVQRAFYETLDLHNRADYIAHKITAANEGVLINKLLQISGGYVYTNDKVILSLDPKPKLNALAELIEEAPRKVLVFATFKHTVAQVHKFLTEKRQETIGMVTGDTPLADRNILFNEFQHGVNPKIIVAHPQCMSHGLTLTAADTIIWYLPTDSNEIYEQANARISRAGQTHPQLIVHLATSKAEGDVYRRLKNKQKVQGVLLSMYAGIDEGL